MSYNFQCKNKTLYTVHGTKLRFIECISIPKKNNGTRIFAHSIFIHLFFLFLEFPILYLRGFVFNYQYSI